MAAALLILWSAGSPFASDVGGEEAEKDLQKLQGTWGMVSGEFGGEKVSGENLRKSTISYERNKIQLLTPHQFGEPIIAEIVKLDTTKTPKQMHFIRKNGPSAGKTLIGIYEFEGNDQYRFALDPTGVAILKEFATKEGSGHIRHTWKRVKP
jgi:uncharacterized protein (TIGR03067 family)